MTERAGREAGTVVHRPTSAFVESTNVWAFMQEYDIEDVDELIERTTSDVPGEDASGLDWFWGALPDYLDLEFDEPFDAVREASAGPQFTDWYVGGSLNVAFNTLDRYARVDAPERNSVACIWEGEPGDVREVTYHDLHRQANKVANYLDQHGVGRGDTVALYMPMVPEVISILYGTFKVGAVAVPIFSGFGVDAVATRLEDCESSVLFTGDGFYRRGSEIALKETADEAISETGHVEDQVVFSRLGVDVPWRDAVDEDWGAAIEPLSDAFATRSMNANDPCMLLYSSGTTGKPKGIVHTHAGALVQPAKEIHFGFDLKPGHRFFWVSDIGWMMGPWTLIGNHAFGGTVFMYEGAPDHPRPNRFWEMIDRHELTQFGISPTAIRALRKHGKEWLDGHDLSSLHVLGSTGEPWDAASWRWFYDEVGGGSCPVINISGGTEIFGCFLMPMPIQDLKPCTLGGPGLGMDIDIVDEDGDSIVHEHERGYLVARDSNPAMTRSLWSGDERYLAEYWSRFDDLWNHGDWALMDEDGFWFLHGRADDAINVAGRKVGPAEVEGALIGHGAVNQAAAIGVPDDTTGKAVVAYVILEDGFTGSDRLRHELREHVGEEQGKPFRPREVIFIDAFPKTQSGKIIRRAIEAAYTGEDLGDLSSLENPESIDHLRERT